MNQDAVVDLFLEAMVLKRMPRTGWTLRGVVPVESVAEHSYGVAFVALALADLLADQNGDGQDPVALDVEKVLIMALLHDLAEVRLTDLPLGAAALLPDGVKRQAEAQAIAGLLAPLRSAGRLNDLWAEFEDHASPEGRLVRDADKLEMMVQCLHYERAGFRGLDGYWTNSDRRAWHYPLCGQIYTRLRALRPDGTGTQTQDGAV